MMLPLIGQRSTWFYVADEAEVMRKILRYRRVLVKKYIRIGITIFEIFILEDISSCIRSEIMFKGSAPASQ